MASSVEKRTARAFPFFRMERFAIVMPTCALSSVMLIFLCASMTSRSIRIAILRLLNRELVLFLKAHGVRQ